MVSLYISHDMSPVKVLFYSQYSVFRFNTNPFKIRRSQDIYIYMCVALASRTALRSNYARNPTGTTRREIFSRGPPTPCSACCAGRLLLNFSSSSVGTGGYCCKVFGSTIPVAHLVLRPWTWRYIATMSGYVSRLSR
jgi:hypothetical protein